MATAKPPRSALEAALTQRGITLQSDGEAGGQAIVYKVSTTDNGPFALKLIPLGDDEDGTDEAETVARDEQVLRANREIDTASRVSSPYLVARGDIEPQVLVVEDVRYYAYSTSWVNGVTLREVMRQGRITPCSAVTLASHIGQGVGALWEHHLVHRDIKPANIMVSESPLKFTLLDYGVILDLGDESLTAIGVPGSARYLSPEQSENSQKRQLDFRSDLFSLGIVIYEATFGEHPFYSRGADTATVVGKIRNAAPTPPTNVDVPANLVDLVLRLLNKRPHSRFRSTSSFLAELARVGEALGC